MQKQTHEATNGIAAQLEYAQEVGSKAIDVMQTQAMATATATEKIVRKHPLASVGVALGGGVALGALGYRLLAPKRQPTLLERLGLASLAVTAAKRVSTIANTAMRAVNS